jgi:hypothetical protein
MKKIFKLINKQIISNATNYIFDLDIENNNYQVIITDELEKRRNTQNRLMWHWITFIADVKQGEGKGRSKEDWHNVFKYKFLKPYLIEKDGEYQKYYDDFMDLLAVVKGKHKSTAIINFATSLHTTELTVKTMAKYLTDIDNYARDNLGVLLPVRDDFIDEIDKIRSKCEANKQ